MKWFWYQWHWHKLSKSPYLTRALSFLVTWILERLSSVGNGGTSVLGYEAWKAWCTFNRDIFLIIVKWRKEGNLTLVKYPSIFQIWISLIPIVEKYTRISGLCTNIQILFTFRKFDQSVKFCLNYNWHHVTNRKFHLLLKDHCRFI